MMIARLLTALVGGSAVTIALLLGMNELTKHWKERDATQYFSIADFIPADPNRRPEPPPDATAPPDRPAVRYDSEGDASLPVQRPSMDDGSLDLVPAPPRPGLTPDIERSPEP